MSDHDRCRRADDLAELASRIAVHLVAVDIEGRTVVNRIREAMLGQPKAQHLEADRTTGHTTVVDDQGMPMPAVSDPTGEAAIRPDKAAMHLREVDDKLRAAHAAVSRVVTLLALYTPRPATDGEQRSLELDNDPGCESCSRTESSRGVKRWEPVWKRGNPGGVLRDTAGLCAWCYTWTKDTGRLPSMDELALHHSGNIVKRPA